ncbi:MAG: hypothetical protein EOS70_23470 [Mesorhizobium sp.]|uniref:hypothetical protein n=1 Tax=Mesorhizobium sp. TaxID=1871066 RepID=UPI000FE6C2C8|nr:hypothetical protein [Mesorhizobium sp.]RWC29851.1 MAG: hypothetical protein EOS70_23470 [Mesorhizobium sp.]
MFFFAWVASSETTFGPEHEVEDEQIVSLQLTHKEGGFCTIDATVQNPRIGLLAPGRDQWAWLSYADEQNPTAGTTPLAFCRIVGVPQSVQGNAITLQFMARPADYDTLKRALAETMKVRPYWDPMWLTPESRTDPDTVLEGYTKAWHIDRVTHAVTASDILVGEDGLIDFAGNFIKDSLDIQIGAPPVRSVKVSAEINWDQDATGNVDLTQTLIAAFKTAGSNKNNAITSLTGEGLMRDWPEKDDRIGGGWDFGECSVVRTDGVVVPQEYSQVVMTNGTGQFPVWTMKPVLTVDYEVSRKRQETLSFTLVADCQALVTEPGDEEIIEISASGDADEPVDPPDTDNPLGALPIGDVRNRAYLPTARGRQSLEYLIALARGAILERSRAVEISFTVPFRDGLELSCRKNARVADGRIPGGEATGKIIGYTLSADSGRMLAVVTIGCTIGKGNTVTADPGEPVYGEEGYVDTGYQLYEGATYMPVAGEVTYEEFGSIPPNDDGVDFFNMLAADNVVQMTVVNGITTQSAVLSAFKPDLSAAIEALNQVYTEVDCDLRVLKGGPFITDYPIVVSDLMVPLGIDLEAA